MKIKVTKPFSYAHNGFKIVHYAPGLHDVCKRCADIALEEGWASKLPLKKKRPSNTKKKGVKS